MLSEHSPKKDTYASLHTRMVLVGHCRSVKASFFGDFHSFIVTFNDPLNGAVGWFPGRDFPELRLREHGGTYRAEGRREGQQQKMSTKRLWRMLRKPYKMYTPEN